MTINHALALGRLRRLLGDGIAIPSSPLNDKATHECTDVTS